MSNASLLITTEDVQITDVARLVLAMALTAKIGWGEYQIVIGPIKTFQIYEGQNRVRIPNSLHEGDLAPESIGLVIENGSKFGTYEVVTDQELRDRAIAADFQRDRAHSGQDCDWSHADCWPVEKGDYR